jgi:hypothetical protein
MGVNKTREHGFKSQVNFFVLEVLILSISAFLPTASSLPPAIAKASAPG